MASCALSRHYGDGIALTFHRPRLTQWDMIWYGDSITDFWEEKAEDVWEDMYDNSESTFRGYAAGITGKRNASARCWLDMHATAA